MSCSFLKEQKVSRLVFAQHGGKNWALALCQPGSCGQAIITGMCTAPNNYWNFEKNIKSEKKHNTDNNNTDMGTVMCHERMLPHRRDKKMIPLPTAKGETAKGSQVPSSCLGVLPCSCRPTPTLHNRTGSTTFSVGTQDPHRWRTNSGVLSHMPIGLRGGAQGSSRTSVHPMERLFGAHGHAHHKPAGWILSLIGQSSLSLGSGRKSRFMTVQFKRTTGMPC